MTRSLSMVWISGSRLGQPTVLTEHETTIGTAPSCDLVIHDRLILPHHAAFRTILGRWFVVSLDPRATLFVNGEPVTTQQRVNEGDLVTLGTATFRALLGQLAAREVGSSNHW
ncbi:MAG: FHA domain-containing protein [Oscillochloridaceae bacterium umkhey_bin13]